MEEIERPSLFSLQPVHYVLDFLSTYGWWVLGATCAALYAVSRLRPRVHAWQQAREDAAYHKDPDVELKRMEAIQRARERQQEMLAAESARAAERQKEREERKRAELLERASAPGSSTAGGNRLGAQQDYMPLSGGGGGGSTYRAPKKSKCGGGGCGK